MAEASPAASQALPETVADAVEAYLDAALSRMRPATYRAVEKTLTSRSLGRRFTPRRDESRRGKPIWEIPVYGLLAPYFEKIK